MENVIEFYVAGETRPFYRIRGVTMVPRVGDEIDIDGKSGMVRAVQWNLDGSGYGTKDIWRANVYIREMV